MELADRLRGLTRNEEAYRDAGETDEQVLATAREIDANMTYLGMDDAIIEIAAEVEKVAKDGEYHEYEIRVDLTDFRPPPDAIILARLPKNAPREVFEKVQHYMKFKFPDQGVIVMHEDADISTLPDAAERILNYLASLHQQAARVIELDDTVGDTSPEVFQREMEEAINGVRAALILPPDLEAAVRTRT